MKEQLDVLDVIKERREEYRLTPAQRENQRQAREFARASGIVPFLEQASPLWGLGTVSETPQEDGSIKISLSRTDSVKTPKTEYKKVKRRWSRFRRAKWERVDTFQLTPKVSETNIFVAVNAASGSFNLSVQDTNHPLHFPTPEYFQTLQEYEGAHRLRRIGNAISGSITEIVSSGKQFLEANILQATELRRQQREAAQASNQPSVAS